MSGPVVELALDHISARCPRALHGEVRAVRIQHVDVIRPGDRVQTSSDLLCFIFGKNEYGNHQRSGKRKKYEKLRTLLSSRSVRYRDRRNIVRVGCLIADTGDSYR